MANYRVTGPDGSTYQVSAPDTASQEEVLAYAQRQFQPAAPMQKSDPTEGNSFVDNLRAGIGAGMASGVRALGGGSLLEKIGLPGTKEEAAQLDAPLRETTGGKVGSAVGIGALAAPAALVPGANTYVGATLLGAGAGGALTEGGVKDRLEGAALGAVGGAGGVAAGRGLSGAADYLLQRRAASMATQQAANAQKDAAAQLAQQSGYVLPPADVKSSAMNEVLNGLSGKIKTAQVASARNQSVTDELARKAIGLKPGDALDASALQQIRQVAAQQGYTPVRNSGMVQADQIYQKAIDDIAQSYQGASKGFPGLADNGVMELTAKLQQPLFDASAAVDATQVLRAAADKAYRQGDNVLGKANKAAADAIEGMLERHLQAANMPDALQAFQAARTLIAKTYSVQKGLNDQTGQVSAQALAKQLEKGRPLSGELETIAQVAQAFPTATQSLREAPKSLSPLDFMGALIGSGGGAHPAGAALLALRPAARTAILSQPYQARMLANDYAPGFVDKVLLENMMTDPFRRALTSGAIGGSVPANQ
jgi:hypothetical protein